MEEGTYGGYNIPPALFWKEENVKLERAFLNFAREEREGER